MALLDGKDGPRRNRTSDDQAFLPCGSLYPISPLTSLLSPSSSPPLPLFLFGTLHIRQHVTSFRTEQAALFGRVGGSFDDESPDSSAKLHSRARETIRRNRKHPCSDRRRSRINDCIGADEVSSPKGCRAHEGPHQEVS